MKKRLLCILLIVSMLTASNSVAFALGTYDIYENNGLTESEIELIAEEVEKLDLDENPADENYSVEEYEAFVGSIEGIECLDVEEDVVNVEDAVSEIFNNDEISQMDTEKRSVTEAEGERYVTETYQEEDITYVKTYSEDKTKMSILKIEGNVTSSETYLYNNETGDYEKRVIEFMCDEESDEEMYAQAQGITYNSKIKSANWKDSVFWYRTGQGTKNDKGKTFLKIGCKAEYRINTTKLSSAKAAKCDKYMNRVKQSKTLYNKATAYFAGVSIGGGFSIGWIAGAVATNFAFPPATIAAIIGGAISVATGVVIHGVNVFLDSYEKWQDARDYYNVIKTYGVKL